MNTSLLEIIKRIVAEQGENILSDPKKLKAFVSDYAKDEPKEDRVAFGRAIELGFYNDLKRASTQDRANLKASLLPRLQAVTTYDTASCIAAIDLIEAVIYGNTSSTPIPQAPKPMPSSAPVQETPALSYQQPVNKQPQITPNQPQTEQEKQKDDWIGPLQMKYSDTPFFRRNGFINFLNFIFVGVAVLSWFIDISFWMGAALVISVLFVIIIYLTGDIYTFRNEGVYKRNEKSTGVILLIVFIIVFANSYFDIIGNIRGLF